MKFDYSTSTRTLTVYGKRMTHIFQNTNESEISYLIRDAQQKEKKWKSK